MRGSGIFLAVGLGVGLGAFGLLSSCQDGGVQGGADLRPLADLRTSAGNPVVGVACQTVEAPCPQDPRTMMPVRCATIVELDQVGACAPACRPENQTEVIEGTNRYTLYGDCDTVIPGLAQCVRMTAGNTSECVIFCDSTQRLGRECPQGWSCVASQGFRLCRPPQTPLNTDMR